MEILGKAKNLITEAKNICLIPSENEPESLVSSLALFYTLKELGKNVNLVAEKFPEKLNFLVPSLDFISSPKNFVISIPRAIADVSQIYYEKTDENLKIHLTTDKGQLKKENISFYFQDAKPDLVVTLGIADFKKYLENKLDSFGFLLGSPILNIDNHPENLRFGQANIIEQKSLSEVILSNIKSIDENLISKSTANCLLAGLIIYYENFKSKNVNEVVFQTAAELIKKGADNQQIADNLNKKNESETIFWGEIIKNLKTDNLVSVAILESDDFKNFSEKEAVSAIEKIRALGTQNDLLVLWKSRASNPIVKGFFYSKNPHLVSKIAENYQNNKKEEDWVFLSVAEEDMGLIKNNILKLL